MDLHAVVAVFRLHWGFSVRAPLASATAKSLLVPPATSLAGALAEAMVRAGKLSCREVEDVDGEPAYGGACAWTKTSLVWAAAALETPAMQAITPIRYFTGPYQSDSSRHDIAVKGTAADLFNLVGLGVTASIHGRLRVVYLFEERGDAEEAAEALRYLSRLGSKESFVDPIMEPVVVVARSTECLDGTLTTAYPIPLSCIKNLGDVEGAYRLEDHLVASSCTQFPELYKVGALAQQITSTRKMLIPVPPVYVKFDAHSVGGHCKLLSLGGKCSCNPFELIVFPY